MNKRTWLICLIICVIVLFVSFALPKSMGDTPAMIGGISMVLIPVFLIAFIVSTIKAKRKSNLDSLSSPSAPDQPVSIPTPVAPHPVTTTASVSTPVPETLVSTPAPIPSPSPKSEAEQALAQKAKAEKRCRLCGRKGFMVVLDDDGYCPACAKSHAEYVEKRQKEADARRRREEAVWSEIHAIPVYEFSASDTPRKRNTGYERITFSNITPKGRYDNIVVFDTETTGLAPSRDIIIELAAIRYVDGKPVSRFHSYINPERPIPSEASKINGITDDMVADAPVIGAVIPAFDEFIGDSILIAHNLEFDLKYIYYSGSCVFETKRKYIDTLEQSQKLLKKPRDVDNHKLSTLCDYYGITIAGQHSALADVYATGELFFRLVDEVQG